jgi:hypothetical protein
MPQVAFLIHKSPPFHLIWPLSNLLFGQIYLGALLVLNIPIGNLIKYTHLLFLAILFIFIRFFYPLVLLFLTYRNLRRLKGQMLYFYRLRLDPKDQIFDLFLLRMLFLLLRGNRLGIFYGFLRPLFNLYFTKRRFVEFLFLFLLLVLRSCGCFVVIFGDFVISFGDFMVIFGYFMVSFD